MRSVVFALTVLIGSAALFAYYSLLISALDRYGRSRWLVLVPGIALIALLIDRFAGSPSDRESQMLMRRRGGR